MAGDLVTITEQTLDGSSFLIVNCTTGEKGKVPVDYIDIGECNEVLDPSVQVHVLLLEVIVGSNCGVSCCQE